MVKLESFALGLIETIGLVAGIEAADTAVKSSNVEVIGYENSKGGTVVVKIKGDVGAVKAAIQSASTSAALVNKVLATSIIPRPNSELKNIIFSKNKATTSLESKKKADKVENEHKSNEEVKILDDKKEKDIKAVEEKNITCNLCMDTVCSRKKGEPRTSCIHFNEIKK
ncbi:BMC domain-containing protein [uncultured Clostridium sp.]|uniref:BMC domain-containing protein n=1 Tax=uncultured Clostridium sp. TaxID=59620 RepID=UPI0028ED64E0|nr:BMC domain-containing protein [uncultured Clostridium sp.]